MTHCPACGRLTTWLGALGCRAPVQDCQHPWHCRKDTHRALAHRNDLRLYAPTPDFTGDGATD